jgi:hypothetical protein
VAKVLWTQKQDIGPQRRAAHAMTFDVTRQRVVLFGGASLDGTVFGDTWEWDGESWTQVQDIGPGARSFHAMAYDSVRRRTVLFGGAHVAGPLGDTWEWDGENWTQVADSGPAARSRHAMTFDAERQRIVVFGGASAATRLNDTWEWDGDEWVQQADSGPSPRIHPAMAFDSRRNRVVLFGGVTADAGLGDTWEWDGEAWTEEADFGPDACLGAAMVFKTDRIAMFGGVSSLNEVTPTIFSRSWEWDGRHWTARQDMGPGPRVFHAMAFDGRRSRVVLFGGSPVAIDAEGAQASLRGDTWEQFESGPPAIQFANLVVVPNPVPAGGTVTVTVTLTSPTQFDDQVAILFDDQEVFGINMPAGSTEGSAQVFIDPNAAPGSTIVVTVRLGTAEASMPVTIAPATEVQVISLEAVPNPVAPGNIVTLTVTIAAAAPTEISVALETDGQVIAAIPIAAEATSGSLEIPIQPDTPPVTVTLTARSGASQASVDLVIQ